MDAYVEVARFECEPISQNADYILTSNVLCSAAADYGFYDDHNDSRKATSVLEASDCIIDIREFDVPYHVRVAIDKGKSPVSSFIC